MIVTNITINGLRNIESLSLRPESRINQLTGPNGAGKTTVLEAIFLLSYGRSFRTRKIPRLLAPDTASFDIRLEFTDPETSFEHQAGIRKTRDGETQLRLDFQNLNSIVEVTRLLPVKIINPDSHQLVQEGPDQRREYIDWGVFHVEQSFFQIWKQFRRALQQRNQILRLHGSSHELQAWDKELAVCGEIIHAMRRKYIQQLEPVLEDFVIAFGMPQKIGLKYRSGWKKDMSLIDALTAEQQQDIPPAFTTVGPHRAELALSADGIAAKDILSRGEQKLLVYALHFAQIELFQKATSRHPVVLLDDLSAELDTSFSGLVLDSLAKTGSQAFISGNVAIQSEHLPSRSIHQITQGKLCEVI